MKTYIIHHVLDGDDCRLTLVPMGGKVFGGQADVQAECDRRRAASHHTFEVAEVDPQAAADAFEKAREEAVDAQFRVTQAGRRALLAGAHALFAVDPGLRSFAFEVRVERPGGDDDVVLTSADRPDINGVAGETILSRPEPGGSGAIPTAERDALVARQEAVAAFLRRFEPEHLWDLFDGDTAATFHRDGRVEAKPLPE